MNQRNVRVFRGGNGLLVNIPKDWVKGMEIEPGDELVMRYNGRIILEKPEAGSQ